VIEGRFDGQTIDAQYFTATPYMKDGRYFVRVEGKDSRPDGDHEITRVVGRSFVQAYLATNKTGRWPVMPICWSLESREWKLTHEVLSDIAGHIGAIPDDYDTRTHIFNHGCGQCHATDYDVGHDVGTDRLDSKFLEGAVACESCHGAGSVHQQHHEQDEYYPDYKWPARLVDPKRDLDARQVLDSCGRCHYLHEWDFAIDADPRVGWDQIATSFNRDASGFLLDGRLAGLSYHGSSQSQSPCYLKGGMSCLSCHRMHGGEKWAMKWDGRSNKQCTQCHDADEHGEPHTHHPETVACVDCHMPRFLDGALHFLRDHAIRTPDPALTEKYGAARAPNACNRCHVDKDVAWARDARHKWWGEGDPQRHRDTDLVARLRDARQEVSTELLIEAGQDPERRIFVRLTALKELHKHRAAEAQTRAMFVRLLAVENVEILQHACLAQARLLDPAAAPGLMRLLDHPVRTVRVFAGTALLLTGWRGGSWRGGRGIDEAMERVYKDVRDLLVRQRQLVDKLEKIALFADAVGTVEEADDYYTRIIRLSERAPGRLRAGWRTETLGLMHRRGRRETEAGHHTKALLTYGLVAGARDGRVSNLLRLDRAESFAALGRDREALRDWRTVIARANPRGAHYAIAQARLDALAGKSDQARKALARLAKSLEANPVGGDMLRRVRPASPR